MRRLLVSLLVLGACGQDPGNAGESESSTRNDSRPNILLIVADDLGYSDIGAYGGEITTPNIDSLAEQGLMLTSFYTSMTCSPTRAMLMSGVDSHIVGLGNMAEMAAENQLGLPGYEGHLNDRVDTIGEVLVAAGYHTYMSGKWHLGTVRELAPANRGFEQSFALLYGGGSHFVDMAGPDAHRNPSLYRENGKLVRDLPDDFYSTKSYTDTLINQIDSNIGDGNPFFAYLAYTAPHWPLQAPDDYIAKYRGTYDVGYDEIREQRFARQKELGLFDTALSLPPRPVHVQPWDDLSRDDQRFHAANMEIYAAMVHYMDMSIGRVIDYLQENDELENTVILFMSDNGAEQWNYDIAPPAVGKFASTFDNSLANSGREGSFVFYGPEWAHVSNTPFTRFKGSTGEGGIHAPAIVVWPGQTSGASRSDAQTFVSDWFATFVELGGVDGGGGTGTSLIPIMTGTADTVRGADDVIGIELWGARGVIRGDWKLLSIPPPRGTGEWELYNLKHDPFEQSNLADANPQMLEIMQQAWREYADANNVVLPDGPFIIRPPNIPTE